MGHKFLDSFARRLLGVCLCLSAALIYGSRVHSVVLSDDFIRYYASYVSLLEQDSVIAWLKQAFGTFGFELGLPVYYGILTFLFGELHSAHLLFYTILLPCILLLIWLEKYGMQGCSQSQKSLCVLLVFLFFNFVWTTWLTRQTISSIWILYSISAYTTRSRRGFGILACLFHLTALPILVILFASKKYPKTTIFAWVIVLMIFTLLLEVLYGLSKDGLIPLDMPLLSKFGYYVFTGGENVAPHFNEVAMLVCMLFAFLLPNDTIKSSYAYIFYVFFIMYFFLYFLAPGSMGQRSTLLLTSCLFGFFLFLALRRYYLALLIISAVFLILRIKALVFAGEDESVRNFYAYPPCGDLFYYLYL